MDMQPARRSLVGLKVIVCCKVTRKALATEDESAGART
jgi:hypothetical protein